MDSYELSQWMAYYSLQNNTAPKATAELSVELSDDDEINMMKEVLA